LYGNDIDETTTPLEAGLEWIVGWQKEGFDDTIGAAALREQKAAGVPRRIVGFEMIDSGIARHGHDVFVGGVKAGSVTSGTQTPFLKKAIGMAYLTTDAAASASTAGLEVDIRGRRARAQVVPMPFYKRRK
jgi:aminomethyltransferase